MLVSLESNCLNRAKRSSHTLRISVAPQSGQDEAFVIHQAAHYSPPFAHWPAVQRLQRPGDVVIMPSVFGDLRFG